MSRRGETPIYFGPRGRALFGWLHPAPAGTSRGVGVVLCNTIGNEAVGAAQTTLRYTAEQLTKAGFSVLRFEFHGNGDSTGCQSDPDRIATWLEDIDLAIIELRGRTGVEKIALAGLRLGGTLAMAAAARRDDVSSLVLWDPYCTGTKYAAEMNKLHRIFEAVSALPQKKPDDCPEGREALGFFLSKDTLAELAKLDLTAVEKRPAPTVRLICSERALQNGGQALLDRLRKLGAEAQPLALAPHLSRDIQLISNPNHRLIAADLAGAITTLHDTETAAPSTAPAAAPPAASAHHEQPLLFGPRNELFGILTSPPDNARRPDLPAVITVVHRLGPNRNYVRMARELADLGFHVLRLDLCGRGDSLVEKAEEEESPYPLTALSDVREAMALLEKRISAKRFIVAGLCSGADIAFQAGLADPKVVGVLMINPRTFALHDIPTLETLVRSQDLGKFVGKVFDRRNWKKLLRGEFSKGDAISKVDTKSPLGKLADAVKLKLKMARAARSASAASAETGDLKSVPAGFRKLAKRGADTLLVVRDGDLGVTYVDSQCRKAMRALEHAGGFSRITITEVDHNFTTMYGQQELMRAITGHLSKTYLGR